MMSDRHWPLCITIVLAGVLLAACGGSPVMDAETAEPLGTDQTSTAATATTSNDQNRFDSSLTLMAPDGYAEEFFSLVGDERIDLNIHMLNAFSDGDYWPQAAMILYDQQRVQFLACRLTQNEAGDLALSFARGDGESQIFEVTATDLYLVDHPWFTEITLGDDHLILSIKGQDPWYLPLDFVVHEYSLRVSSARSRFEISYPELFDGE